MLIRSFISDSGQVLCLWFISYIVMLFVFVIDEQLQYTFISILNAFQTLYSRIGLSTGSEI